MFYEEMITVLESITVALEVKDSKVSNMGRSSHDKKLLILVDNSHLGRYPLTLTLFCKLGWYVALYISLLTFYLHTFWTFLLAKSAKAKQQRKLYKREKSQKSDKKISYCHYVYTATKYFTGVASYTF